MQSRVDYLNETARAYYTLDEPLISDKQWDALYGELQRLERETGVILPDSPSHRVGGDILPGFQEHTHLTRLWSMDKVQSLEALEGWIDRTERLAGKSDLQYFVEYKFDGLTLNLTYNEGKLVQAATRGNGVTAGSRFLRAPAAAFRAFLRGSRAVLLYSSRVLRRMMHSPCTSSLPL